MSPARMYLSMGTIDQRPCAEIVAHPRELWVHVVGVTYQHAQGSGDEGRSRCTAKAMQYKTRSNSC